MFKNRIKTHQKITVDPDSMVEGLFKCWKFSFAQFPEISIWVGAVDDELTAKSYIVPGLGDAGDLCYGSKGGDVHSIL